MAKDYKNRIPAYRRQKQRNAARNWALAGAAAAAIAGSAGLGFYFFSRPATMPAATPVEDSSDASKDSSSQISSGQHEKTGKATTQGQAQPEADPSSALPAPSSLPEPRVSFYKVLPEKEAIIAENEIKAIKREENQGKKPSDTYLLQAGSFTSQTDAEKLKSRLADIKITARLEMITLDSTTWYRVKIGPYATVADADQVRQYLRSHKLDSIVQKTER